MLQKRSAPKLRITSPYLLLIALTAIAAAALNTFQRFAAPAVTPVLLNLAMIAAACWWAPFASTPIYVLAWAVLIGGVLQLGAQLPGIYSIGFVPIPRWQWKLIDTLFSGHSIGRQQPMMLILLCSK